MISKIEIHTERVTMENRILSLLIRALIYKEENSEYLVV